MSYKDATKITGRNYPEDKGTKHDEGKLRLDLIPTSLEKAVGTILTSGANVYGPNNWREGISYTRVVAALKRHLNSFLAGDLIDKDSGKPHLWHVACNVAFLIEFEQHPEKYANLNDLFEHKK